MAAPILITMGEPSGIGPEIALKAFRQLEGRIGGHPLKLVGDAEIFSSERPALIATQTKVKALPGKPDPANAAAVIEAIAVAATACLKGEAAAMVTAPIHKKVLQQAGFAHPGHTEFLGFLTGARRPVMMLASEKLRVVPLTIHTPLKDVPASITQEAIVETGEIILAALTRDFAVTSPRLAIAGLNPHAGEEGMLGGEEKEVIAPAAERLKAKGHRVIGPLAADTLFHDEAREAYDAALTMYHDQGLIPIKTLSFWDGVNVTLGLPIVRTSPDHGTAFDIAGKGRADDRSMIAAIRMAAAIADARAGSDGQEPVASAYRREPPSGGRSSVRPRDHE